LEGPDRNPRIDDLQAILFDQATYGGQLRAWLQAATKQRQGEPAYEEIEVGLGCSSNTLRLADDIVSYHSAAFARGFRDWHNDKNGVIQVSDWQLSGVGGFTKSLRVPEVDVSPAKNDPDWTVRVVSAAKRQMLKALAETKPNETGGLMFGRIDKRTKTIYVTQISRASPDSESSEYAFHRGIKDVPESVESIMSATGNQIYYVGEWHTHPKGPSQASPTDLKAANAIRANLDRVDMPTHIAIVTSTRIHSFLFGVHTRNPVA
jgi:integrative and conjugative element protein (TIGR02256 family)